VTGDIENSTCCENTAPEHRMMDKFVTDSLVVLTEQYGFDGYRFDVMGHMTKDNILNARTAVQAIDPDNYFYGEGWNFGEVADNRLFEQATQANMAGSEVGTFNDRIREAVRGGTFFSNENTDGNLANQDTLRLSMAGNLQDYILKDFNGNSSKGSSFTWNNQPTAYALDPADSIHYVSKHDNETLWDQMQYSNDTALTLEERVRIHNVALGLPIMSQGIPFLQLGGDLLRSKSMDRNSYDSGDWFNYVDFTMETNNWNVGLPLAQDNSAKWAQIMDISGNAMARPSASEISFATAVFSELLTIRQGSPLFKLTTMQDVIDRVGFHNIGKRQQQGLIVMSIDDGIDLVDLDAQFDALVVVANGSEETLSQTVATAQGFELHPLLMSSVDSQQANASFADGEGEGTFTVPPYSISVFVKMQGDEQGEGLKANATAGAPDVVPYGSTEVFVRGSLNGWSTDNPFTYNGSGEYRAAITIAAGDYEFKIASEDWNTVDFGALTEADVDVEENVEEQLTRSGPNMKFSVAADATYIFSLDATDKDNPVLTVYNEEPFVGTAVFVRGTLNGWSEDDQLTYIGGSKYQLNRSLAAGDYEFKIASADWSTVDFGSGEATNDVTIGQAKLLAVSGDNMTMNIAEEAEYSFIVDFTNRNEPLLSVYPTQTFGATPIYVRGSLNGWGTDNMLEYQGNSTYIMEREVTAGDYEFKIASEDWNTIDLGAPAELETLMVDQAIVMQPVGDNINLTISEDATYRFTLTGPDAKAPNLIIEKL
jgi:pullulanase